MLIWIAQLTKCLFTMCSSLRRRQLNLKFYKETFIEIPNQLPTLHLPVSQKTPFRTEMCTFLFCKVYCGIWDRWVVGFVLLLYIYVIVVAIFGMKTPHYFINKMQFIPTWSILLWNNSVGSDLPTCNKSLFWVDFFCYINSIWGFVQDLYASEGYRTLPIWTPLQYIWYVVKLFYYAWVISLQYHHTVKPLV